MHSKPQFLFLRFSQFSKDSLFMLTLGHCSVIKQKGFSLAILKNGFCCGISIDLAFLIPCFQYFLLVLAQSTVLILLFTLPIVSLCLPSSSTNTHYIHTSHTTVDVMHPHYHQISHRILFCPISHPI